MSIIRPLLISFACAILLTTMYAASKDKIAQNRIEYEERILRELLGDGSLYEDNGVEVAKIELEQKEEGYLATQNGEPVGFIWRATTDEGYNGRIGLWVAIGVDGVILGLRTFEHHETPGLGDAIDTARWMNQFVSESVVGEVRDDTDRWDVSQRGGQFDAISGATITSRATIRAIYASLVKHNLTRDLL